MTTVVIADDHELVRRGLHTLLQAEPDCKVLAEVADGQAAIQAVGKLKPTVLFLDLSLPRLHGLEVLRQTRSESPQTKVIILSMHDDEPYVIEALRGGARAYVLKGTNSTEIAHAFHEVLAGRRFLSAPLSEWAINALAERPATGSDPMESLTSREREVLRLAAGGADNRLIAEKLFISPRTAETHRTNFMRKLGLHTQTDLVRFAIRKGLIEA